MYLRDIKGYLNATDLVNKVKETDKFLRARTTFCNSSISINRTEYSEIVAIVEQSTDTEMQIKVKGRLQQQLKSYIN